MPAAKFEIVRKCKICGEPFKAKTIESWYCSPRCSKIAWKRNKDEELRMQKLDEVVKKIPKSKDYITVPEAYALFGISKETLYRLILSVLQFLSSSFSGFVCLEEPPALCCRLFFVEFLLFDSANQVSDSLWCLLSADLQLSKELLLGSV